MSGLANAVSAGSFVTRFTLTELGALITNAATAGLVVQILALGAGTMLDVTDTQLVAGMAAAVAAGILTSDRSAQILNLAVNSP